MQVNISKVIRQEWLLLRFFFTYIRYIYALRGIEHKTIPYCKLNRLQARNQEELLVASDEMERKPDWLPGFPVQINWVQINCNRGRKNPSKGPRSTHLPGVYQKIIPYNTHGAHQCGAPRGCLYCSECCISFCRNPENANGRGGLRYEKLHSHNAISAPIYPMDADHFSRPGRNSAYRPHALPVTIFCTICSPVSSLVR